MERHTKRADESHGEVSHELDLPPPDQSVVPRLGKKAIDVSMTTPATTEAQKHWQERRKREKEIKSRALEEGRVFVQREGRRRWILPQEFLDHVMKTADVEEYTAKFVFDNLRSLRAIEYDWNKGIRSPQVDVDFAEKRGYRVVRD